MNTPISLLSILLFATSLVAQDAPIPQELPLQLRQTRDAIRRKVEQPIPQNLPWQRPTNRLDNGSFLNRLRATDRQPLPTAAPGNAGSVEDRIAVLEAKIEALQREIEAQTALIKQLRELLDQQQKKN